MKTLTLSLLATFCTLLSFGQNLSDPAATLPSQTPTTSQAFLSTDRVEFASMELSRAKTEYYMNAFRENSADQCAKYHKLKTVGIILSAVGGGLFVTGIALIAIGVHDNADYGYNVYNGGYYGTDGTPLIAGGAVLMVFGLASAGAGIPLAIIGSVKSKKYCGGGRSELQLGTNGHNLALNF